LVIEVAKTLRQDEQNACDGNEIKETKAFATIIIDLEEEDGNTQNNWILLFQAISCLLSCLILVFSTKFEI
jgi:hypothetical protein